MNTNKSILSLALAVILALPLAVSARVPKRIYPKSVIRDFLVQKVRL